MGTVDSIMGVVKSLPKAMWIKEQLEALEQQKKLAEDKAQNAEKAQAKADKEIALLRAEVASLNDRLAFAEVNTEYVDDGPFKVKKGETMKRCPTCYIVLSYVGGIHKCQKCNWAHEEPSSPDVAVFNRPPTMPYGGW